MSKSKKISDKQITTLKPGQNIFSALGFSKSESIALKKRTDLYIARKLKEQKTKK